MNYPIPSILLFFSYIWPLYFVCQLPSLSFGSTLPLTSLQSFFILLHRVTTAISSEHFLFPAIHIRRPHPSEILFLLAFKYGWDFLGIITGGHILLLPFSLILKFPPLILWINLKMIFLFPGLLGVADLTYEICLSSKPDSIIFFPESWGNNI